MITDEVIYKSGGLTIHRIQVDIPIKALKKINCYLVESGNERLLVDTGMGIESVKRYVDQKFGGVNKVFATHFHIDHVGGAPEFLESGVEVYMSRGDIEDILFLRGSPETYINYIKNIHRENGVPPDLVEVMFAKHPGWWRLVNSSNLEDVIGLNDGEVIRVGSVDLRVVLTPGHTPNHACLFIEDRGLIFVGDHILSDITPNIPLIRWDINPLKDFVDSLYRVRELKPKVAYPAHRSIIEDVDKRISELLEHHKIRLAEVLNILKKGAQTAYEVASKMTWDVKFRGWDEFPPSQKYFAVAEALSHLKYLLEEGKIYRENRGGVYYYSLVE